jgi:hypothetical protein
VKKYRLIVAQRWKIKESTEQTQQTIENAPFGNAQPNQPSGEELVKDGYELRNDKLLTSQHEKPRKHCHIQSFRSFKENNYQHIMK